jgi:hypothetical protein
MLGDADATMASSAAKSKVLSTASKLLPQSTVNFFTSWALPMLPASQGVYVSWKAARRGPFDNTRASTKLSEVQSVVPSHTPVPPVAARAADAVEIESFAVLVLVELVVTLGVPAIDDGIGDTLRPHVDAAAAQPLARRRGGGAVELEAVHAMRDAVVLPGHVAETFGGDARVGAGRFGGVAVATGSTVNTARFSPAAKS